MLKVLPIVLAVALCFSNLGSIVDREEIPAPAVDAKAAAVTEAKTFADATDNPVRGISEEIVPRENILRLHWAIVPNAVKYEVTVEGASFISYTNGIEIPVRDVRAAFQIRAIALDGMILDERLAVLDAEENPAAPLTTTEFDKMNYPPLYPVYSWIPVAGADHYEIELIHNDTIIRRYFTQTQPQDDDFDFYDKQPILDEGEYFWRVRGLTKDNQPVTQWSMRDGANSFTVTRQIRFCAFGDSITHGGGAISVPPSTVLYNWETYCPIPIKNLGHSGDTTAELLARFESDVLTFRPEVLFIMAGVNDYRAYIPAWQSVENLEYLRDKCHANGIRPVFITPTPLNPAQIRKVGFLEMPPPDWQESQRVICDWIRQQEHFIDVNDKLCDAAGDLNETLSVDGLHPDAEGKRIIGEAVAAWLDRYMNLQ